MNPLIRTRPDGSRVVALTPGKRVLFLTKDPERIRGQLEGALDFAMTGVDPAELLDDINTDVMTPAWVCFRHRPEDLALDAYAGLVDDAGERVFPTRALMDGGFEVIVSGKRKGTGSSRETAAQAERWSGIHLVIAASFAPIHRLNNLNLGQLMGSYAQLERLQAGEEIPLEEFTRDLDPITRVMLEAGGLFPFAKQFSAGEVEIPRIDTPERPMTMAEKILAAKLVGRDRTEAAYVRPGDVCLVRVDGGYSHEFTSAQVHHFLLREYGHDYALSNPTKFAVFEDHLLYATGVPRMARFRDQIETLRRLQHEFQAHTGVRDYSAKDGVSPGICHQVAREQFVDPSDFIQATDSHTCMGGGSNALAWGVGATEYASLIHSGFTFVRVPESIRFELHGQLAPGCTAKDLILSILDTYAKREETLSRVMEFGGPGLASLSMDERATLTNMATECSARTGICEGDDVTARWLAERRPRRIEDVVAGFVAPDPGAEYTGGVHTIDLAAIRPMVAEPGDPTYGKPVDALDEIAVDIAYAGSCTAGKEHDLDFYARVLGDAVASGRRVAPGVSMFIQFGSEAVHEYARGRGYLEIFDSAGVRVIDPGCGACIGCGPGVSEGPDQVTISAINRNFSGRSGPGKLYLGSPLTVAASAVEGRIVAYRPGMFRQPAPAQPALEPPTS